MPWNEFTDSAGTIQTMQEIARKNTIVIAISIYDRDEEKDRRRLRHPVFDCMQYLLWQTPSTQLDGICHQLSKNCIQSFCQGTLSEPLWSIEARKTVIVSLLHCWNNSEY